MEMRSRKGLQGGPGFRLHDAPEGLGRIPETPWQDRARGIAEIDHDLARAQMLRERSSKQDRSGLLKISGKLLKFTSFLRRQTDAATCA